MNLGDFRTAYPEFDKTSDALVNAKLNAAAIELSPAYWGTYYDQGHGLLTAALLADAPNGQTARLQSEKANSTYRVRFEKLREEITFGDRVF